MQRWMQDLLDAASESWRSFQGFGYFTRRWIFGTVFACIVLTILAWKVMTPLILLAIFVVIYLRRSKRKAYCDINEYDYEHTHEGNRLREIDR